jgi:hypothetical protein
MVGWEGERVRLKWGSWAQGLSGRLGVGFALGSRVCSIRKFSRLPFPGLDFIPDYSARSSVSRLHLGRPSPFYSLFLLCGPFFLIGETLSSSFVRLCHSSSIDSHL